MFRTMLWKEYRDGRTVWTALALLGVATVLVVPAVLEVLNLPRDQDSSRVSWLLKVWLWVYSLITGSLLLAGERENTTLPFLDHLQPRRGTLWLQKFLASTLFGLLMGGLFTV